MTTSIGSVQCGRRLTAHAQSRILSGITYPEVKLTVAIIGRAVLDALHDQDDGRAYVQSSDFAYWCDLVGIDPDRIRRHLQEELGS